MLEKKRNLVEYLWLEGIYNTYWQKCIHVDLSYEMWRLFIKIMNEFGQQPIAEWFLFSLGSFTTYKKKLSANNDMERSDGITSVNHLKLC